MNAKKKKKVDTSEKGDKLSMHQQFDLLIDEYYPELKDKKPENEEKPAVKEGDYVFKSVDRTKIDYARIDENDEPPNFTDLVPNEPKLGAIKITNPLPKIEKRNELKDTYMHWLKTEKLMQPMERRLEYQNMQQNYLESIRLNQEIKKDVKLARVIKSHYPRGVVGVDSIYNENTILYKDQYNALQKKNEIKQERLTERRKVLDHYNNANGNFLTFNPENK